MRPLETSRIAGTVKAIYVNKGDAVSPDETLVEIG